MPRLILVRHSNSDPKPGTSPHTWDLSEEGRRRAELAADAVVKLKPVSLHTSVEPKATSTAEFIAAKTGLAVNIDPRFNEHARGNESWTDEQEFKQAVKAALKKPGEQVYGSETISEAVARFKAGIADGEKYCPRGDMAIVSGGTVISGLVAEVTGADPVELWSSLSMPALVVINWPDADGIELLKNFD